MLPGKHDRHFAYARNAMTAAALLVSGYAIDSVIIDRGRAVFRFPAAARPALQDFLTAFNHARAVADRAMQEPNSYAPEPEV